MLRSLWIQQKTPRYRKIIYRSIIGLIGKITITKTKIKEGVTGAEATWERAIEEEAKTKMRMSLMTIYKNRFDLLSI